MTTTATELDPVEMAQQAGKLLDAMLRRLRQLRISLREQNDEPYGEQKARALEEAIEIFSEDVQLLQEPAFDQGVLEDHTTERAGPFVSSELCYGFGQLLLSHGWQPPREVP